MQQDFSRAYQLASSFLENENWAKHWREPLTLFRKLNWVIIPYDRDEQPVLSNEAYATHRENDFFILYSEENYPKRTTFNLHHEAGHVIGAHTIIYPEILSREHRDPERLYLEREATIIGRNVFLPAPIIKHLIDKFPCEIDLIKVYLSEKYSVSSQYLDVRLNLLEVDICSMIFPCSIESEKIREYNYYILWKWHNKSFYSLSDL